MKLINITTRDGSINKVKLKLKLKYGWALRAIIENEPICKVRPKVKYF